MPTWSSRRCPEQLDLKRAIFSELDTICGAGHDPRHQHLVAVGHRDRGRHRPSRQGRRPALLQPGAGDEAGRGDPQRGHRAGRGRRRRGASRRRSGKVDVTVGDRAGFIANALLFGYLNHAAALYESRYASREDIDAAMKLGCGLPMGPLALLDLIGLDTAYEILDTMYKQGRDRLHAPQPIFKQMITAGLLGRKSGRGFYTYDAPGSPNVVADAADAARRCRGRRRPRRCPRSASSARGRWRPASSRCSPRPATTSRSSRAAPRRPTRSLTAITRSLEKAVQRGKLAEADRDAALAPDHRHRPRWTISPTCSSWSRPSSRTSRSSRRCSPTSTTSARRARCSPRRRRQPAGDRVRGRHVASVRRHRHALLQPGGGHEARRGRVDGRRPRPTSRRPCST